MLLTIWTTSEADAFVSGSRCFFGHDLGREMMAAVVAPKDK